MNIYTVSHQVGSGVVTNTKYKHITCKKSLMVIYNMRSFGFPITTLLSQINNYFNNSSSEYKLLCIEDNCPKFHVNRRLSRKIGRKPTALDGIYSGLVTLSDKSLP